MAKAKKRAVSALTFGRGFWSRSPVQRAHSTPKGKRGYVRREAKQELRREVKDW